MMSSINKEMSIEIERIHFTEAVKTQYLYKLNAYHSMLGTMILIQMIAMILIILSPSGSGIGVDYLEVDVTVYASDGIISFTMFWAFIMAIYLTTKASKNMMFTFISDKSTNHIANIILMITFSA